MAATYVQSNPNSGNGASALAVALTGVGAGATLVLMSGSYGGGGPVAGSTVSGGGATWTRRSTRNDAANITNEVWVGYNSSGGSVTVTYTPATTCDLALILAEDGGMPATEPFDVATNATGNDASPDSGLTAATAQADEIAWSSGCHSGATITVVPRAGDGYTQVTGVLTGATTMVVFGAYQILSATGTQHGRWTLGSASGWCAGVVALKAAAAGATEKTPYTQDRQLVAFRGF